VLGAVTCSDDKADRWKISHSVLHRQRYPRPCTRIMITAVTHI